jgi:hypothetical protein
MTEAIEITTFKLRRHSCSEFVAANAEIDDWLRRQRGFRSRRIAERDDGAIVDMLIWDSVADGEAAMRRLMEELRHSEVHSMIDQRSVSWTIASVQHNV